MTRMIDADALIEIFEKDKYDCVRNEYQSGYNDGLLHAEVVADNLPTVDAVSVVHGRWIDEHYYSEHKSEHVYRCSNCGWHMIAYPDELFHYCPICGARMDAERKEE